MKQKILVEEKRKEYKKIASNFKNTWLELRADATAFNKKVLSVEKELLGIVEPERDRLENLSNEYVQKLEKKKKKIYTKKIWGYKIFVLKYSCLRI